MADLPGLMRFLGWPKCMSLHPTALPPFSTAARSSISEGCPSERVDGEVRCGSTW